MISRRGLIGSLISLAAAPAIVRASSLMPVKVIDWQEGFHPLERMVFFKNRVFWLTGPQIIAYSEVVPSWTAQLEHANG